MRYLAEGLQIVRGVCEVCVARGLGELTVLTQTCPSEIEEAAKAEISLLPLLAVYLRARRAFRHQHDAVNITP